MEKPSRTLQLSGLGENAEDRRTTSGHGSRFRAKTDQLGFDLPEFSMPGEDNFLKVVAEDTNTSARYASPNLLLETIQFIL
jgi:hypothetical protein